MNDLEIRKQAKAFADYWANKGYEKGESQPFWLSLLRDVLEVEHKTKYTSGRASYVERNQAMINDSDFCIFYYDENYEPEMRKYPKRSIGFYQPKSGTKLAYDYAKQKRKILINMLQI